MGVAFSFRELSYKDMLPYGEDYRLILHPPQDGRHYYAMVDDDGTRLAVGECTTRGEGVHIDCLFVPEAHRGHGHCYHLLMYMLFLNQEKYASAQANDWSIKTFLKAGFKITSTRKCKYWTAYYVHREPCRKGKNGETEN